MKRRQFLKVAGTATAMSALAVAGVKSVIAKEEVWPWVAEALANRRAGKFPNYIDVHQCCLCKREYYCTDRYLTSRCEVRALCREKDWNFTDSCLPCKMQGEISDANRNAWWEAHRL